MLKKKKKQNKTIVKWKENSLKYTQVHVFLFVSVVARASPTTSPLLAPGPLFSLCPFLRPWFSSSLPSSLFSFLTWLFLTASNLLLLSEWFPKLNLCPDFSPELHFCTPAASRYFYLEKFLCLTRKLVSSHVPPSSPGIHPSSPWPPAPPSLLSTALLFLNDTEWQVPGTILHT